MKRRIAMIGLMGLVLAACGGSDTNDTTATTSAPTTSEATTTEAPATTEAAGPATSPAEIVFEAQDSDGTSIVVASITLPSAGFIAVHANADGSPGPVIGHSDLLPAGTSTDVVVTLDEALTATDLVFPMAHIDVDENGAYEFAPPENATDGPATTAEGDVAVVGAEVSVATAAATDGATVAIAASDLGDILVDADGNVLYLFVPDGQSESTCYEECATNWPPLLGEVGAGAGVDASLLGTTTRTDDTIQATYNGWPLYYFIADAAPGETNGQGVNDVWFVLSAQGDAVE